MLDRLIPPNSMQRRAAATAAATALLLFVTQVVLPGTEGGGRGTPIGVLFQGVVFGALNALTAIGIVLIYRSARIINFAQAALGATGAIFTYNFVVVLDWPYGVAFVLGVMVSALIGLVTELFLRKFFNAPRLVVTIVTIGVAGLLAGAPLWVESLGIWGEGRSLEERFGGVPVRPLPDFEFQIGGYARNFGAGEILSVVIVVAALLGIGAFLRYTRMGIAVRASSENADRAELLGINVKVLSSVIWVIAGALSGAGLILFGTVNSFVVGRQGAPQVLIIALAAAVLARMRSLPVAAATAIGLVALQQAVLWSYPNAVLLLDAGFFVLIAIGLLLQRRELQRAEEVSSWEATEEIRPTPRELFQVGGVRFWRWVLIAVGSLALLLFPWVASVGPTNTGGLIAITAIVLLSLVVLTGWAGQVSLGQWGFVAIGAVVGGAITGRLGVSFWLALPAGAIVSALFAVLIGIPALRIKGLFLGIVTFAFAFAVRSVLFEESYFGWLLPQSIERPTLLLLDFEDERSMYYLALAGLALSILLVLGLRRTRPGRVLIALRENEADLQAFGINAVRARLSAFAFAGFLAGFAGVLFAHHQRAVTGGSFEAQMSIDVFIIAVIGGISSVSGALLGSLFQALINLAPQNDPVLGFFLNASFGLLVILYVAPGGLAALMYGLRDAVLRIVAQRRQLAVPSLFADYDPSMLERQLIPLGESTPGVGLSALPQGLRYRLRSELYDGKRAVVADTGRTGVSDEERALSAAAERAKDQD